MQEIGIIPIDVLTEYSTLIMCFVMINYVDLCIETVIVNSQ